MNSSFDELKAVIVSRVPTGKQLFEQIRCVVLLNNTEQSVDPGVTSDMKISVCFRCGS